MIVGVLFERFGVDVEEGLRQTGGTPQDTFFQFFVGFRRSWDSHKTRDANALYSRHKPSTTNQHITPSPSLHLRKLSFNTLPVASLVDSRQHQTRRFVRVSAMTGCSRHRTHC